MPTDLQKKAEETLGVSGAQQLFRKYAVYHLKAYFSDNIHQIAWDMAGYVMPPVMLQLLLNGRGYDSFSARNVDLMMTGALQLTNFLLTKDDTHANFDALSYKGQTYTYLSDLNKETGKQYLSVCGSCWGVLRHCSAHWPGKSVSGGRSCVCVA